MTWIDSDNFNTPLLTLVGKEAAQLSECPAMQTAHLFAMPPPNPAPDFAKVLNHDGCPDRGTVNNAVAENMITIPVETQLLARQLAKMAVSRLCSFGLQLSFNTEVAAVYFFPVGSAVELALRCYRRMVDTQIYAYGFSTGDGFNIWYGDNDVQVPLALAFEEICTVNRTAMILCGIGRQGETQAQPFALAAHHREGDGITIPIHAVGFLIVTRRAELRAGLAGFAPILQAGERRSKGFSGFDPGLNNEVANQASGFSFGGIVSGVMQAYTVLFVALPTISGHHVKS